MIKVKKTSANTDVQEASLTQLDGVSVQNNQDRGNLNLTWQGVNVRNDEKGTTLTQLDGLLVQDMIDKKGNFNPTWRGVCAKNDWKGQP